MDSEPSKHSLIRGASNSVQCANLVEQIHSCLYEAHTFVWFSRVPTKSNPADAPSRFAPQETIEMFNSKLVPTIFKRELKATYMQ